jgi:hypothetical protein
MRHTHTCIACQAKVPCHAAAVDNYDGFPEKYCSAIDPQQERSFVCEDCGAQGLCDSGQSEGCAVVGTRKLEVEYLTKPLWLCVACYGYEISEQQQAAAAKARR